MFISLTLFEIKRIASKIIKLRIFSGDQIYTLKSVWKSQGLRDLLTRKNDKIWVTVPYRWSLFYLHNSKTNCSKKVQI